MSDNIINVKEPGGEAAGAVDAKAVQKPKVAKTNKPAKVSSEAEAQVIANFLRGCVPYQADAYRVAMAIGNGEVSAENLSDYDRQHLNGYLNATETAGRMTDKEAWTNRRKRLKELLGGVKDCLSKEAIIELSDVLNDFAANREYINEAVRASMASPANN